MENYINFDFYIPTRIIFKKGALESLPQMEDVKNRRCGLLKFPAFSKDEIIDELKKNCAELLIIDEFEENPGYGFTQKIAKIISETDIETLIAIGGGSTIDTAKAALYFVREERQENIKLIAVPTTSGTGSEVTPYAILTNSEGEKKILNDPSIFPDIALCDADLTATMPKSVTANTGIDALCHAAEAYLSIKCQGFMENLAYDACCNIYKSLPAVLESPDNMKERENMLLASLQGGIVLARCGTVMVHALGYCLTEKFGYAHGYSNAMLLEPYVSRMAQKGDEKAARLLEIFGCGLKEFISQSGIPAKLPQGSVTEDEIQEWVEKGYKSYGRINSTTPIERDDIEFILNQII